MVLLLIFSNSIKYKLIKISNPAVNHALSEENIGGALLFGYAARPARMYSDPDLYRVV